MKRRQFLQTTASAGLVTLLTPSGIVHAFRANPANSPEQSFKIPPASARPFTWWHWMNGNVTKDGITRDLEAMARVGVGGFQAFSVSSGIPKGPADYLSPLWIDLMQHAAIESERLGLEFNMHNCMGWSSSGGSWITPELSMQQTVWSEVYTEGGKKISLQLPQPFKKQDYYRDTYVLAFPSFEGESKPWHELVRKITLNGNPVKTNQLTGFDLATTLDAGSRNSKQHAYLQFEFDQPFEARSVSMNASGANVDIMELEVSDDGSQFRKVAEFSSIGNIIETPAIACFPVVKAKYFRISIPGPIKIANVRLLTGVRTPDWTTKANYLRNRGTTKDGRLSDQEAAGFVIHPDTVTDLTKNMDQNGLLNWDAPAGKWTILRFGHTTTGITNHPAEGTGLGLECDKYSREAFDFHFNYIMDKLMPSLKPLAAKGKLGVLVDSYEVNMQNWTKKIPAEFEGRRGYNFVKYLPALTGRVVGSPDITERFLWDFRRTCADMMADHYQGRFVELCRKNSIISYTEPYNNGPFEEMQAGAKMDINMGEFWIKTSHFRHSLKLASSIQNMNGRQIVGAESFTGQPYYSRWQEYPFAMKAQGDYMFTRGLNRYIFHRYAQQPHPTALPGMTMGQWGFHFDRTNTWFEQGKAWLEYVARCQFMLQQGVFAGDVICYCGQDAPGDDLSNGALLPELPDGYDFQFANAEILLNRLNIKNGRIVLPDGMSFRLMLLPPNKTMTIQVMRKLRDLVNQGMILAGPKPEYSPSLSDYPNSDKELKRIAEELWGPASGTIEKSVGSGRVFSGFSLQEVLNKLAVKPDFEFISSSGDAPINFIHRKIDGNDLYFVANRRRFAENLVCTFRVEGKEPEFWNADTGEITPVTVFEADGGRIKLPLQLDPGGSVFIVFKKSASTRRLQSIAKEDKTIMGTKAFPATKAGLNKHTINNFTISLWVKPETEDMLPAQLGQAPAAQRPLANYAIYAPAGEILFGQGHAAVGLLVARNGVVVYEREKGQPSAVLIAPMAISSWTHFAVTYSNGEPSLYVNGKFIKKGAKSDKSVHPAIGEKYKDENSFYYEGDMSKPEVIASTLTAGQIAQLAEKGRKPEDDQVIAEETNFNGPALLIWENGRYSLNETTGKSSTVVVTGIEKPMPITGEWTVTFPPKLGAPESIVLPRLMSLHTHPDDGVKYFSGTAVYHKKLTVSPALVANKKRVFMDLGRIAVIAEVTLNDKDLGIVWKPPYRLDITDAVKAGSNDLQIKVTNLWPNRLIGDEQLPEENEFGNPGGVDGMNGAPILKLPEWYQKGLPKPVGGRVTFTTWKHFKKDSPLLESGLIGPVVLRNAAVVSISS
jgi:hypothetical protein